MALPFHLAFSFRVFSKPLTWKISLTQATGLDLLIRKPSTFLEVPATSFPDDTFSGYVGQYFARQPGQNFFTYLGGDWKARKMNSAHGMDRHSEEGFDCTIIETTDIAANCTSS